MGGKYSLVGGKQAIFYPDYILNPPKNIEQFYCQGFLQSALGVEYRQSRWSITRHSSLLKSGTHVYHSATGLPAALFSACWYVFVSCGRCGLKPWKRHEEQISAICEEASMACVSFYFSKLYWRNNLNDTVYVEKICTITIKLTS